MLDRDSYVRELQRRMVAAQRLRDDPRLVAACLLHYRDNPIDFINDWGVTVDPRLPEKGLPAVVPFRLFPRQVEMARFILDRYAASEPGVIPKSRDIGATWVAVSLGVALCLFREGLHIGYGSRKEEYVDKSDAPKAMFPRARQLLEYVPPELRRGWDRRRDAPHMRISFPATGSVMTGEAGDNIGRGDRASIYFVDEAAFLERPQRAEASLSATTNCRIDLSSANGMDNPFAEKVHSWPAERVFRFHWRDDPRKDDAWYAEQCERLPAVVVAQEIDINFSASKTGIILPSEWVQAAIGAAAKLGIEPTGQRLGALDVADEGADRNAWAGIHGIELQHLEQWSGKGSDPAATAARAVMLCDDFGTRDLVYDADGLGASVRGDVRILNEHRAGRPVSARAFRGSGSVVDAERPIEAIRPARRDPGERLNKDMFANFKAQAWHSLRLRFERTFRAVTKGEEFPADQLVSLSPDLPELSALVAELSQPTWAPNSTGKLVVDKAPDGSRSPNLADAVMMAYAPTERRARGFLAR